MHYVTCGLINLLNTLCGVFLLFNCVEARLFYCSSQLHERQWLRALTLPRRPRLHTLTGTDGVGRVCRTCRLLCGRLLLFRCPLLALVVSRPSSFWRAPRRLYLRVRVYIHARAFLYDRFCVSCVIELPKISSRRCTRAVSPRLIYAAPVLVWLEARRTRGVRSSPVRRKSVQDTELN